MVLGTLICAAFLFCLPGCASLNITLADEISWVVRAAPEKVSDVNEIVVQGDSHAAVIDRLHQWAAASKIQVVPMPNLIAAMPECCYFGVQGYQDDDPKLPYVLYQTEPYAGPNMQASTLIHELAHVLHGPTVRPPATEIIAETVSFGVCRDLRLDTRRQSAVFLAQYEASVRAEVYRVYDRKIQEWRATLLFAAGGPR